MFQKTIIYSIYSMFCPHFSRWISNAFFIFFLLINFGIFASPANPSPKPLPPFIITKAFTTPGEYTFTVPIGVTQMTVEVWGGGGRGGSKNSGTDASAGGGGGAYSSEVISVTPGESYVLKVGAGSNSNTLAGEDSWVSTSNVNNAFVLAKGGNTVPSNGTTGAEGGLGSEGLGSVKYSGGRGADRSNNFTSGGGGSSAGTGSNGNNAVNNTGGIAPTGGGDGGNGRINQGSGSPGLVPGGGGGGSVRGASGSPSGGNGANGQVFITYTYVVDAGEDLTQCHNALFNVSATTPPTGFMPEWSIISGTGYIYNQNSGHTTVHVPAGSSATLRLTVTDGITSGTDDIILTNTTGCVPGCSNPINLNHNLEEVGTANAFNLSFQGTPTTLIYQAANPIGWSPEYNSNNPNTTNFTGAYYLQKNGSQGNPHSGNSMIYLAGNNFGLSGMESDIFVQCGRTYKISAWVAAFSNTDSQTNATFNFSFSTGGPNMPDYNVNHNIIAPASVSWNNLNWQRYSFDVTIPANGFEWSKVVFTSLHNVNGIVIDDLCIDEIVQGSYANAGIDTFACSNNFELSANVPDPGYTGLWSVVSGNVNIGQTSSPSTTATLQSGNVARLRWNLTGTGGGNTITLINPDKEGGFENGSTFVANGWTTVGDNNNPWAMGESTNPTSGNKSAYIISNSGAGYGYNTGISQASHFYRDVVIHPEATNIVLSFKWKGMGESGHDRLLVYTAPTGVTPSIGVPSSPSTVISGATLVSSLNLHSSSNYQTANITLPGSLAGTTSRLIFTWQNDGSAGTNPPTSIDEISLTHTLPVCSYYDDLVLAYANSNFEVTNDTICIGDTATISATGCDFGSISWSTGETTGSVEINPSSTTTYSAICTPVIPSNILLNPGYESLTDIEFWTADGISPTITSVPSEVHSGSRAVKLDGTGFSGILQPVDVLPGERYVLKAWAKTTNTNKNPRIAYNLYSAGWSEILLAGEGKKVTGSDYQEYTIEFIIPPNVFHMNVFAEINGGILYVDDWALYKYTSCIAEVTGEVLVNPLPNAPTIGTITQPTCIVTTGSVILNDLPASGNWTITKSPGGNIYNGTGTTLSVTDLNPNTTYNFSVTNSNGCISYMSTNVNINDIPSDPVLSGDTLTCVGTTAGVLPSSDGTWTSNNTSLATITNNGIVTGILPGSVDLTYVRSSDGCSSTKNFNIYANPLVPFIGTVTQPTCLVTSGSVELQNLPSTGNYTITRWPDGYIYNGNGTTFSAEGLPMNGNYTFSVTDNKGCVSTVSANVNINGIPSNPILGGDSLTCEGTTSNLAPSTGGSWFSADTNTAVITNQGLVTGISSGQVTMTYTRTFDGCSSDIVFTVFENPDPPTTGSVIQPTCIVPTGSVEIGDLPSSGNWTITVLPDGTTLNGSGSIYTVTSLAPDSSFVFKVMDYNGCISSNSTEINILPIPTDPILSGDTTVCIGANAFVLPDEGGVWTSNNHSIASVLNNGQVTGTGAGLVTLTYTRNIDGCDNQIIFEVYSDPLAPVVGIVTAPTCITPLGSVYLSGLPDEGNWTLTATPGGNIYFGSGENYTVSSLSPNTTFTFTVTDHKTCISPSSANIVINPIPADPVLSGDTMVCIGAISNVFPDVGGVWSSNNTAIATIANNGEVTGVNEGTTTLTYTRNSDGCDESWNIIVHTNPATPIPGNITQPTCLVPTGSVEFSGLPSTGEWEILVSPEGISYFGTGTTYTIDNLPPGNNYTLTVIDYNACVSVSTEEFTIFDIPSDPIIGGDTYLCIGATTNITPSTEGTWFSDNTTVATITNEGLVTGIGANSVILTYTRESDGCSSDVNFIVHPLPLAPAVGTIIQPTCTIPTGSVILDDLPASGDWVITRTPGDTIYMDNGESFMVTELPPGTTYTFALTNQYGCLSIPSAHVNILNIPSDPALGGLDAICNGLTTNLTPSTGGNWSGDNNAVATVSGSGLVNAVSAGNVLLTYTRTIDGCSSTIDFTVLPNPVASLETFEVCSDSILIITATPTIGLPLFTYQWNGPNGFSSTNQNVVRMNATLSMSGLYTVTITDANGCIGTSGISAIVNPRPMFSVSITDVTTFNGNNGAIDLSVSSGTSPFTYVWSNGATTQDITNLSHGLYTVTITDSKSCRNHNLTEFSVGHPANCSGFRTQTMGGWGSPASGDNPGVYRNANFAGAFPDGLEIGCTNTLRLTSAAAVQNFLPCGGPTNLLPAGTLTDPGCIGNVFAGQLVALTLSTGFDLYDPDFSTSDQNLVDSRIGSGPFYGMSVQQLLNEANNLIGGCGSSFSASQIVTALTDANENYVDGKVTGHFLICCQINMTTNGGGTICAGNSLNISANASNGTTPYTYQWSHGLGTGAVKTVNPTSTQTYTVTVTDGLGCSKVANVTVNVNPTPMVSINAPAVCENATLQLTPFVNSGTPTFTYNWTGPGGFTSTSSIINRTNATTNMSGLYFITVTDALGCSATSNSLATVNVNPLAPVIGLVTNPLCIPSTGSVILEGLPESGTWTIENLFDGNKYGGTGTTFLIEGLQPKETYTFLVIDENLCSSPQSLGVTMSEPPPNPVLGGNTETCVLGITYVDPGEGGIWLSSNNSVASVNNDGEVTALAAGTTTLTYIRDIDGCSKTLLYTVYSNPVPPVISTVTQPTCITPTGSIVITGLPDLTHWTITRYPGAIPYTGYGTSLTIQGLPISSAYSFTVINHNNCISTLSANAIINGMPENPDVNGDDEICVGDSTFVTPLTGGVWISSDPDIADITNEGLVHGLSSGNVTLTYTRNSDGCSNTLPFNVNDNPNSPVIDTIIQPTCIVPTGSVLLSGLPSEGTWTLVRMPGMVQYTGSGTTFQILNLPPTQTYTFLVRNANECLSPVSMQVVINSIPSNPELGGDVEICVGFTANVTPSSGGSWTSSNNTIATITNSGIVTGVAAGFVTLTYIRDVDGCQNTKTFNVRSIPATPFIGTVVQPTCITPTGSVTLNNLTSSGSWTITMNPGGYTFNGSGATYVVSSMPINQTYTFTVATQYNCHSSVSANVTILGIPDNPVLSGDTEVCVGAEANVLPSNSGTWTSSNTSVATVTNQGLVTGSSAGIVVLTYTRNSDGCYSTLNFEVHDNPEVPLISSIIQPTCLDPFGTVSLEGLPDNITWTLTRFPGEILYSGTGTIHSIIDLPINSTYEFTVTNENECVSPMSTEVVITGMPEDPILGGDEQVCIGFTANVTPDNGGTWSSSNHTIATIDDMGVVTGMGSGAVTLLYTRDSDGCTGEKTFSVYSNPLTPFIGTVTQPTCIIPTGSVVISSLPSTGNWQMTIYPGEQSISGSGSTYEVLGLNPNAIYTFVVNSEFECSSQVSANVEIFNIPSDPILGGNSIICIGSSSTMTPSVNGIWTSSDDDVVSISNSGVANGVSLGSVTLTYTRTSDGCFQTKNVDVQGLPEVPLVGTITQPTCLVPTGSVVLSGLPSFGNWIITRSPGGVQYSGSGTMYTITGLAPNKTYTFTVTNHNDCISQASVQVETLPIPDNPVLEGIDAVCLGGISELTPNSQGEWVSSEPSLILVSNEGIVTTLEAGSAVLTYTRTNDGCSSSMNFYANPVPNADILGPPVICSGGWGVLEAVGGVIYQWSNGSNNSTIFVNNSGLYLVTVTNSYGCSDTDSILVTISSNVSVEIDYNGSPCFEPEKEITAIGFNGLPPYFFNWAGPSGMTGNTPSIVIGENGNYYVTITDSAGCTATSSGYVYQSYEPFVVSLNTNICEGRNIELTVNSGTAVSYQWSENAGSATTRSVLVYPSYPSAFYQVTVTNDIGCTAVPELLIEVYQKPSVSLSGPNSLCVGFSTEFTFSGDGVWHSTNPGVATINNEGIVTGLSSGNAFFIYTSALNNCPSDTSAMISVHDFPVASVSGPTNICIGHNTTLQPSVEGVWISNNPSVASVDNSGLVTGLSTGNVNFTYTNSSTGCSSQPTAGITVHSSIAPVLSGPEEVCVGSNIFLVPDLAGGVWTSSNPSVATVSNSGIVSGVSQGTAEITYTLSPGSCVEIATKIIQVNANPVISFTGDDVICVGQTTSLTPVTGGYWTSSNPTIASVSNAGVVSALQAGVVTFRFQEAVTGCLSNHSGTLIIHSIPVTSLEGSTQICIGNTTSFTPSTGGTWSSSNPLVANININGEVTGIAEGNATFTYTESSTGCFSEPTLSVQVYSNPSLNFNYHGSICLHDSSQLSVMVTGGTPAYNYHWNGPESFEANTQNIFITTNGNYYVTVTDNAGCSANISGFVHEQFEPIITNLNTNVCEGDSIFLSVTSNIVASYLWSANAWNSTDSFVYVFPEFPSSSYKVTVTNPLGCAVVAEAIIDVNPTPNITVDGPQSICIGLQTSLLPGVGGVWTSLNPTIATITNGGIVTGLLPGTARFLYTNSSTQCISDTSDFVTVHDLTPVFYDGPSEICSGGQTQIYPDSGGVWASNNTNIAVVNSSGIVTTLSGGVAIFNFTNDAGCVSDSSISITVHEAPDILLNGYNQICTGTTTQFLPSIGGTWESLNPLIASIENNGNILGLQTGEARFLFTNSINGCISDTSEIIYVLDSLLVTFDGPDEICVGSSTSVSPSSGGLWVSNQPLIATITNSGFITGLQEGSATFTYTSNTLDCYNGTSMPITVNPRPTVSITGPLTLCIGDSTTVSPDVNGTWVSSNPLVATVQNSGKVYAISNGSAHFTFTSAVTGCSSHPTNNVSVYARPTVSVTGPNTICEASTTQVFPSSGGHWFSSNTMVAIVNNSGIVTGQQTGTANFIFIEDGSGCVSLPTGNITVLMKPEVSFTGSTEICQDFTTQLSPNTGGSWVSLQPSIASVSSSGLVTGLANGIARFVFTTNQGCVSDPTTWVTVHGKPQTVFSGETEICIDEFTQVIPSTGGIWVSSNPSVATINNAGLITGMNSGNVKFIFTEALTGCKSDSTENIIVHPQPFSGVTGSNSICIGQTTVLNPTTGGNWISLSPAIADVNNNGIVNGLSAGVAGFRFTDNNTGCSSDLNNVVTIKPRPITSLDGPSVICTGGTTQILPASGGIWTSLDPTIATATNVGVVTGLNTGTARFRFTDSGTGCSSSPNIVISVVSRPSISLNGPSSICVGGTTELIPGTAGMWTSTNPSVATINDEGLVTGVGIGSAQFYFTDQSTGCQSIYSNEVIISHSANLHLNGSGDICVGYSTQLTSNTSGIWHSIDTMLAIINTDGKVTGKAPGKANFYFIESETGCITPFPSDLVNINNCVNPDFNVTIIDVPVQGNLNTNDKMVTGTHYLSSPTLISKPEGAVANLIIQNNGTYIFTADLIGQYRYNIQVCLPDMSVNCPQFPLTINVIDPIKMAHGIIPNLDLATMYKNELIEVAILENDRCINSTICEIDPSELIIFTQGSHGSATFINNQFIEYIPNPDFIGSDTIVYRICADNDNLNCRIARLVVVVKDTNADNSILASDDFYFMDKNDILSGVNVTLNDLDPEGHPFAVTPMGSPSVPVVISNGSYSISSEGVLTFTPSENYVGPVDIPYEICDNEGTCIGATAHILILDNLKIKVRAYLEGSLVENGGQKSPDNRPLMRDNLRLNIFTGTMDLPSLDPYSYAMNFFDITDLYHHVGKGGLESYRNIPDPTTVFAVTGPNAIVDWVFVELRNPMDSSHVLATRSGLLQRDGDVVDLDGVSYLEFPGIRLDSCYVVLRHRNHFDVMSILVSTENLLDFTSSNTPVFDFGTTLNTGIDFTGTALKSDESNEYMCLWAGDFDGNGKLKFNNPGDDQNILFFDVLSYPSNGEYYANYNFSYGYLQGDFDMNGKVKYDNPNDDKNFLFQQVLFHPLNEFYISNFNVIIQQVPAPRY